MARSRQSAPEAVHIVTADDTEVIIPHSRLWSASVFNASSGNRSLLCVTSFYLNADHDGVAVRRALAEIGETSGLRKSESPVKVMASEMPWGTRYKIKAYVADSREQFAMITDLTIRGKERLRTMGVTFAQAPLRRNPTRLMPHARKLSRPTPLTFSTGRLLLCRRRPLPSLRNRRTAKAPALPRRLFVCGSRWLRGEDLNLRPSGYEPDELPGCSTPRE